MTPITQALQSGYSTDDIMKYLQKMMPQMVPMVTKAVKSGYTLEQVLGFLSRNFETTDRRGLSETERHVANAQNERERSKYGLKMAAGALVAPIAGIAARTALSRSLPSSIRTMSPGIAQGANLNNPASLLQTGIASANPQQLPQGQAPQQNVSSQVPPVNPQPPSVAQPNITQTQQVTQPKTVSIDTNAVLSKLNATSKIDDLLKAGNDAESIEAYFKKFAKKIVKKAEDETGRDFFQIVREYEDSKSKGVTTPESKAALQETAPIEKNATVSTPQGIGEVLEIRNGQAIVDVDGKKHKVSEDELLSSPIPEKDLADLYEDLLRGIEAETGEQVSRSINVVGFDPDNNSVIVTFNNGDQYSYDNLDEEEQRESLELEGLRKTSGRTHIGAYQEGTKSPAGNRIQAFIKKLQAKRGGKGNEYAKHYKPVYSRLGPAEEAHKVKYKPKSKKKKPHEEE